MVRVKAMTLYRATGKDFLGVRCILPPQKKQGFPAHFEAGFFEVNKEMPAPQ